MAIAPSSRKLKRTSFQHAKPYSRPTRQISLPTPSPSPTPSPTLHHNSVFAVSCLKPHQADRHFEDPFEHEHELETEIQKTIRLRKEEAATAAYIKACPGCKRSIFRVFDRVVDNKNMACYCGCKFCWRCGLVRKECGCPLTAMVVDPDAVKDTMEER